MNQVNLLQKVKNLENEISEIKSYLGFNIFKKDIDMENWKKIVQISKKIRQELFKKRYPRLYAKIKKAR